jgi:transcriptional regulator GlxA family with amidase domain
VEGQRFVRDGKVVTVAGVMSGIEMSLWLTKQLFGADAADRARDYIAYDMPPRLSSIHIA